MADAALDLSNCPYCHRSINPASIARAKRRANLRAAVPVAIVVLPAPPDPPESKSYEPPPNRTGPLDHGDIEHLRRRLVVLVAGVLARELRRSPTEICTVVADLAANRLRPQGLARITVDPESGYDRSER